MFPTVSALASFLEYDEREVEEELFYIPEGYRRIRTKPRKTNNNRPVRHDEKRVSPKHHTGKAGSSPNKHQNGKKRKSTTTKVPRTELDGEAMEYDEKEKEKEQELA